MKRKTIPKKINNVSFNQLYKETKKLVDETNKRLERLEKGVDINKAKYNPKTKRFERSNTYTVISETGKRIKVKPTNVIRYNTNSWASKKLQAKLSQVAGVNPKDIKITKNMNYAGLRAINKATKDFLNSKTSTIQGIRDVEKKTKENLADLVGDFSGITNDDIETLYNFFEDPDYKYITQYIDPSELDIILADAKSGEYSKDDFLRYIDNYVFKGIYQDDDLVQALENIYNKFV